MIARSTLSQKTVSPLAKQRLCYGDYTESTYTRANRAELGLERTQLAVAAVGPHFYGGRQMKQHKAAWITVLALLFFAVGARAQTAPQAAVSPSSDPKNIQAYIDLLRADVRQQKAEMMGAVMQLSAADAAKFWPIYEQYDEELAKLNDQRVANIQDYANSYNQMTDAKADELIQKAMSYRKQRAELLAKTYESVKQACGGITAARFVQVEEQLLLIIDLQIDSSLPVVGQSS